MSFLHDERHGPLPPLLVLLTFGTGLVDALSYLRLGHVFVANMTGNVIFLGFGLVDPEQFSLSASLLAIAAFLIGAVIGGRLNSTARHRARLMAHAVAIQAGLAILCILASTVFSGSNVDAMQYSLIALLAIAMGLQNAMARRLAVPDMTTTVLTLTLTGLSADSRLAGGGGPHLTRRLGLAAAMFLGAATGALLLHMVGIMPVLYLVLFVFVTVGAVAYWKASSTGAWTH